MSGAYRFHNSEEKLDEVPIVNNEKQNDSNFNKNLTYNAGGIKMIIVFLIMLLILVVILLLILMGMTAYNMTQSQDSNCVCTFTKSNGDSQASLGGTESSIPENYSEQTICNTTEVQAYINQVIEVIKVKENNSRDILLHELQTMDTYFKDNTSEMISMLSKNADNIYNVLIMINGSSEDILQLLQEIRAVDIDSQANMTKMMSMLSKTTENNYNFLKMINGSSKDIIQLLHEYQAMDMDFQYNATEMMSKLLENAENDFQQMINTLSNHKDLSESTSAVVDDIQIGVDELLDVHNTSPLYNSITPVSCKDIKQELPNSPSGFYHVNNRDIYCNMDELCGSGGGWTRLAYLDMADHTVDCPDELKDFTYNSVRMCRRKSGYCSSPVKFPSNGISYSEICGRVIGYQLGSPDAVATQGFHAHNDLNSFYVDGISLTRGSPRQHVWTFMGGLKENSYSAGNCPCNIPPGSIQQVQSFVGSHYFCESGNPTSGWSKKVYTSDPLWDGNGCGSQEGQCCNAPGLPWFHRQYNTTTTDSLDMRMCGDSSTNNEDTPISFYEIFVK